ncbi:MAG: hypothetical protein HW421_1055 [Ignavibacteria bacterium]|nr:hypothetical protein [Ignavibacteria bacterium]
MKQSNLSSLQIINKFNNFKNQCKEFYDYIINYKKDTNDDMIIKPIFWFFQFESGSEYFIPGDCNEYIEYFSNELNKDPNNGFAFYRRGYGKMKLKDYKGALEDYHHAFENYPNKESIYIDRTLLFYCMGNQLKAFEDLNMAIKINQKNPVPYFNRGNIKINNKDFKGAIDDFTLITKMDKIPWWIYQVYNNKAISNYYLGNSIEAIQDLTMALKNASVNQSKLIYRNRAYIKAMLGDYTGVIKDFDLMDEKDWDIILFQKGIAKYKLGKIKGACKDWSKAGELGYNQAYEYIKKYCQK